ncbi:MAG: hypothetical protein MUF01_03580 [Bryobacterales bacterium]|jgi:hypothetical protein|nr:hypothetical protein [Bryobacterales bacterium]
MSRRGKVVVLCEDKRTQQFLRSFLKKLSYENHEIRMSPVGFGSAEQRVRTQYPTEVDTLRKCQFADQVLITALDADTLTVEDRHRQLEESLAKAGLAKRDPDERISVLVPRRNIETWILALSGKVCREDESYKPPPGGTKHQEFQALVEDAGKRFYEVTRPNATEPQPTVDSLNRAIPEARKVPKAHDSPGNNIPAPSGNPASVRWSMTSRLHLLWARTAWI